jgi:hypothetical protein
MGAENPVGNHSAYASLPEKVSSDSGIVSAQEMGAGSWVEGVDHLLIQGQWRIRNVLESLLDESRV